MTKSISATRLWGTIAPLALSFFVIVSASLGLVVLQWPQSKAALWLSGVFPAPAVYAARARAEISGPNPDWDAARREVLRQGARSGPDAAVRLAYIDIARDRSLGQEGVAALIQSYEEAPYDAGLARFRVPMVLESWPTAPPTLRRRALDEMGVLWAKFGQRSWLRALPSQLSQPAGRLAATLTLEMLESQKEKAPAPATVNVPLGTS